MSPVVKGRKGEHRALLERLSKEGFVRVRIDGGVYDLEEKIKLDKHRLHNIDILVDRVVVSGRSRKRIGDSVETALEYSRDCVLIFIPRDKTETFFNTKFSCPVCGISLQELEPRMFSFNSPYGACPACNGLGTKLEFDVDLIIPDKSKSIREGAIAPWRKGNRGYILYYRSLLRELANELGFSMDMPFEILPRKIRDIILNGDDRVWVWGKPFEGVIGRLMRTFKETDSAYAKEEVAKFMSKLTCPACSGARLKKESLAVYINNKTIWEITKMDIGQAIDFFSNLKLDSYEEKIAYHIVTEIKKRLCFCFDVGISYLTLDRLSSTLSGGEAQRIRLATQAGSALSGVIYILDEPTIGLHPYDDKKLVNTLKRLRDLSNTVLVVEHDEYVMRNSDWIIDLGPGAGDYGGEVVYSGELRGLMRSSSITGSYLRGKDKVHIPRRRRGYKGNPYILIKGAKEHNLKNIDVKIPLGLFICVTGVSGSGKSTLVDDILYQGLAGNLSRIKAKRIKCSKIEGLEYIDKVVIVDQSPIGRTPRSNPATYTGVFTYIREVFSRLGESRAWGYKPSRFSFNVSGGRCEACRGEGTKKIEMHFLPDVYVPCQVCKGKRFNEQTLEIRFKGISISEVLEMNVDNVQKLFNNFPGINSILQTLRDVGLGYISLGQAATTRSGGEAQRMKLASQLRKKSTGKTFYIFDEPTTGLHFDDVNKFLSCIQRIVDKKNSVLIIEHNLDVIKCADYIIDLGPQGGDKGGYVVACGCPEDILRCKKSFTARFLKKKLSVTKNKKWTGRR